MSLRKGFGRLVDVASISSCLAFVVTVAIADYRFKKTNYMMDLLFSPLRLIPTFDSAWSFWIFGAILLIYPVLVGVAWFYLCRLIYFVFWLIGEWVLDGFKKPS